MKYFTDKNSLKNIIKDKNGIIVLFYADWCGHCKNLMPTWNSLSKSLPADKINIIKISCVDKEQQCNGINDNIRDTFNC